MSGTPIDRITDKAHSLGACNKLHREMSLKELVRLLFSPQGREFCIKNDFPSVADLLSIPESTLCEFGIYLHNCDKILDGTHPDICIIGCSARVKVQDPEALYHIIALDGANVRIEASGFSVASVDASPTSRIEVINIDKSARISCHVSDK